jgi:hypothetical protein
MTFEEAADILSPSATVDYPSRRKLDKDTQRLIYVQCADGTRRQKSALVRLNFGILRYNSLWHIIHVPSENAIYECESFDECEVLVDRIIRSRIDTNWGYRDLHVFKSILQLIRIRKEHKLQYQPQQLTLPENGSGNASA